MKVSHTFGAKMFEHFSFVFVLSESWSILLAPNLRMKKVQKKQTEQKILDPALERTFRGHTGTVVSVAFSPDLKRVVSGSADSSLMLWNFKPDLRAYRYVGHVC